ncbi:MAG: cation:proton antiporter [Cyanobacteria bacterium J06627_28]
MALFLTEPVGETLRSPLSDFVLLLAIALLVPPVFERLKLPGIVGLLAAGILFGSSLLGWLDPASETMKLLSEIGKIYLMFVAGLEIDLALFQKTQDRSLTFGVLTFVLPFLSGMGVGLLFGFSWLAAVLIGSLLASHTLLAYPIVQRLGIVGDEAVTITVGATIFTDIAALLVLAICLGVSRGDFTAVKLFALLGSLGMYAIAVLLGLKQLAIAFFRATGKDEGNQFLFILLSVFLSAVGAQLIGVEGIIGAFLAGLAINSVIGNGPVKEKTEFLGAVLFIPMFFINMGLLLDLQALGELLSVVQLPLTIVTALLASKWLAVFLTKQRFHYSWPQVWTMWSLSIPQVAATLAAALVGYESDIINEQVFNSVILLMLVTAVVGPLVTARTARQIATQNTTQNISPLQWLPVPQENTTAVEEQTKRTPERHLAQSNLGTIDLKTIDSMETVLERSSLDKALPVYGLGTYTVIVPVYNPRTEQRLLELAGLIARYEKGRVIPLAVALAQPQMNSPQLSQAIALGKQRLEAASSISNRFAVPVKPTLRIEYNVPQAICHASREENANLIVLGASAPAKFGDRTMLGSSIYDSVLWSAHCPVVVARLSKPPAALKNILLPIGNLSPRTVRVIRFAQVLAAVNQGKVTLLHICPPSTSQSAQAVWRSHLQLLIDRLPPSEPNLAIQVLARDAVATAIVERSQDCDVVILRSQRRRIGSAMSLGTLNHQLLGRLTQSVIIVGEPYSSEAVAAKPFFRDK